MRACLSLLLALLLCLNTAQATVISVCDALEHARGHADHFGHHSHSHDDGQAHDSPAADPDASGNAPAAGDQHQAHVHPVFSSLLAAEIDLAMPFAGRCAQLGAPGPHWDSAPHARLDRPPRSVHA